MKYIRIYCDDNGESHFEDMEIKVAPADFAPPAPPLNLAAPLEAERVIFCEFPPGWTGHWHHTPCRQFYFQMSGEIEVEVSDGEVRKFTAGAVGLLDDTSGKGHLSRVVGNLCVNALFVQLPSREEVKVAGS